MKYKIIVDKQSRTNPTSEKREYEIDIEELRCKGDVYDSLIITKEEDYVIRRLSLSKYQVLSVLDEPKKEVLNNINIKLFEGDNYIYLLDMTGNKFYAEYLVKNDFNDTYVTYNSMNSAINQTAKEIDLSVNQKLEGYSTTEEMNATINVKANEITSSVASTYETKTGTDTKINTAKSEIKQTTDSISSEVSKKVGNDEVISKINQSSEAVGINANKIELSANEILNLLAGNAINLSSQNITITSDNFSVDKSGNTTMKNANITGGLISLLASRYDSKLEIKVSGEEETKFIASPQSLQFNYNGNDRADMGVNTSGNGFLTIVNSSNQSTSIHGESVETTTVIQYSLESIKKNISKYEDKALNILKNSEIYTYNLKSELDTDKKHIGFVIPDQGGKYKTPNEVISKERQGIDIYSVTSILWKAIQEQQETIESLIKRIEKLEEAQNGKN